MVKKITFLLLCRKTISCSYNPQRIYNCLLWPESTFVQSTVETFISRSHSRHPSYDCILWLESYNSWPKTLLSHSLNWHLYDSSWKPSFLTVTIDSQPTIASCGWNRPLYNLQLKPSSTFLLQLQLTVIYNCLWLELTYVQRWSFLSHSHNWQPTYDCLLWPKSTFIRFTVKNNLPPLAQEDDLSQLQSTVNLWLSL
jgi:hypothetical protein